MSSIQERLSCHLQRVGWMKDHSFIVCPSNWWITAKIMPGGQDCQTNKVFKILARKHNKQVQQKQHVDLWLAQIQQRPGDLLISFQFCRCHQIKLFLHRSPTSANGQTDSDPRKGPSISKWVVWPELPNRPPLSRQEVESGNCLFPLSLRPTQTEPPAQRR